VVKEKRMTTTFICNLACPEVNLTTKNGKRIKVKFHQHQFETDNAETIKLLTGYESQGIMVSVRLPEEGDVENKETIEDKGKGKDKDKGKNK